MHFISSQGFTYNQQTKCGQTVRSHLRNYMVSIQILKEQFVAITSEFNLKLPEGVFKCILRVLTEEKYNVMELYTTHDHTVDSFMLNR